MPRTLHSSLYLPLLAFLPANTACAIPRGTTPALPRWRAAAPPGARRAQAPLKQHKNSLSMSNYHHACQPLHC